MRYLTFDLTVSATGAPHAYLLAAHSSTQGEAEEVRTTIDPTAPPLAPLLAQLAADTISAADLQALGLALHHTLFVGDIAVLYQRALGKTLDDPELGVRLRLHIHAPELAALPWELLYSPERRLFLATSVETPVSRYVNVKEPLRPLVTPHPVRMLVVMPQNSGLDTSAELEVLEKVREKMAGKLVLDFVPGPVTTVALRAALREHDYHILHYAGHGSFTNDAASLQFDHDEKFTAAISAAQFAQFFLEYPAMRLVVLNACKGATRSAREALSGIAPQLVFRGVPAVIAMQENIANDDAVRFATEFYEELCSARTGGQVEMAISRARKALLQERPDRAVFANPVLYLRAEEGRLWEAQTSAPPQSPVKEKKPMLERWQMWVGLIGGILAIVLGVLELREKIEPTQASKQEEIASGYLRVFAIDSTSRAPLAEVTIRVEEVAGDTTRRSALTTSDGGVHFANIPAPLGARARVYAERKGYRSKNEYTVLPGPLRLELEKIK